jgi:hypothetical protein
MAFILFPMQELFYPVRCGMLKFLPMSQQAMEFQLGGTLF